MPYTTIQVENSKILGIQKNNVYRISLKSEPYFVSSQFEFTPDSSVSSYDTSGHKRALSKFKRPKELPQLTDANSFYIRTELYALGNPIERCNECGGVKAANEKPITFLTPSGKRCFFFNRNQDIVLAFLLRCRPSKHGCAAFNLKIDFISSVDQSIGYSTTVYLETRKREKNQPGSPEASQSSEEGTLPGSPERSERPKRNADVLDPDFHAAQVPSPPKRLQTEDTFFPRQHHQVMPPMGNYMTSLGPLHNEYYKPMPHQNPSFNDSMYYRSHSNYTPFDQSHHMLRSLPSSDYWTGYPNSTVSSTAKYSPLSEPYTPLSTPLPNSYTPPNTGFSHSALERATIELTMHRNLWLNNGYNQQQQQQAVPHLQSLSQLSHQPTSSDKTSTPSIGSSDAHHTSLQELNYYF